MFRQIYRGILKLEVYHVSVNQTNARSIKRWVAPTLRELKRRREKVGPEIPQPRSTFLEWNYDAEIFAFSKRVNENFNEDILKQALRHSSYINNDNPEELSSNNSELIKEGDQIIKSYLGTEMEKIYPRDIASSVVSHLVMTEMLSHVAKHIGLTDIILTSEFPVDTETLSNTFKAVVAALKESDSLKRAELFINDFLVVQLTGKDLFEIWNIENPYEYFSELAKEKGIKEIEPRLCNESASNTILANYQVGLYSNKKLLGIGWGESIEIAKNTAALDAIKKIYKLNCNLMLRH